MKISVITACFNAKNTIGDTIASVRSQRHNGFEIEHIVVDGGSSDGTVAIISEYAREQGSGVRWISESDHGLYDAINKGIRLATGDWIGILNADDVFNGEMVLEEIHRRIVEAAAADSVKLDGVYGDIRFVRTLGGPTVRYCSGRHFRNWMFRFAAFPAHPSIFLRRELFERFGYYSLDYSICADFELMLRLFVKHRIRTRYLPLCTTVMRMGGLSTRGLKSNFEINRQDLRALRANGIWSCLPLIYCKYFVKVLGFLRKA